MQPIDIEYVEACLRPCQTFLMGILSLLRVKSKGHTYLNQPAPTSFRFI